MSTVYKETKRSVMTQRMCQGAEITTVIVESVTSSSLESLRVDEMKIFINLMKYDLQAILSFI